MRNLNQWPIILINSSQHQKIIPIHSAVDSGGAGDARAPLEFGGSEKGRSLISAYHNLAITTNTPGFKKKLSTALSADRLRDKTTKPIPPKLSLQRWVGKIQAMGNNGVITVVHSNNHRELSTFCFMLPTHLIYHPSNTTCIVDILTIRTRRECLR